ncbi:MAG: hypothetical protein QOJ67_4239 [Acidimicrobiaceae bacterium]|jgi:hypothetical protein
MRRPGGDELREARHAVVCARVGLERDGSTVTVLTDGLADVERLVVILESTAKRESLAEPVVRRVLDWRDRMSSYLLAARALDEINVDRGVAVSLLARGLLTIDEELTAYEAAREPEEVPSSG